MLPVCARVASSNDAAGAAGKRYSRPQWGRSRSHFAIKVGAAIVFWFVGRWLIHRVVALIQSAMHRNHIDPTLTRYLGSIVSVALNIAVVLGILGCFGIQTTSIAAMLAGAGVAIGAAWSSMLGNFAAGAS